MLIWLALACSDPEYGHLGEALEAYEEGRVALSTGAPEVAAEAFARARTLDPERAGLVAWEVRALQELGEAQTALARLNAGVTRFPRSELLRFERAKLRAAQGDVEGAATDLRWLYEQEAVHPIKVGEMPVFAPLKVDPSTKGLVPSATVTAEVWAPQETVVVGEPHAVEFEVTSRTGVPIEILPVEVSEGDLPVLRIVEDVVAADDIWTKRAIRVERIATTAGRAALGPWLVQAGTSMAVTERVVVNAIALHGAGQEHASGGRGHRRMTSLAVPSSRFAGESPSFEGGLGDDAWAVIPSGMVLEPITAELGPRMEFREFGQPVWSALQVASVGPARIKQGGAVVVER